MGDMADQMEADALISGSAVLEQLLINRIWITKDDGQVFVEDMTDSHLSNAINFLCRKDHEPVRTFEIYMFGPKPNGELAREAFDIEYENLLETKTPDPFLDMLLEEQKRRTRL